MRHKYSVVFLMFVFAVISVSAALAERRPHPDDLAYKPLKASMPKTVEIELSNGLNGILIEDHEIPVVDVVLLVKTYYPDKSEYGLNEMAQWVMRNGGTQTWPADKLNDELEFIAASIEVAGDELSTTISFNCLKKDLEHTLDIFSDLVRNAQFPEDKIDMKRGTMLEDIRRKNDQPRAVSRREFRKLIYKDHPYAWESTTESVNAIGRTDLVDFHAEYFHPNNAIIGISGDVTKDEIVGALETAFAGWDAEQVTIPEVPEIAAAPAPSVSYAYMDINQAYIAIGHQGINSNDPDRCAVNIMNFILGGGAFTSWITEKVRSDAGLAYTAGSRYSSDPWANGVFTASAQTKGGACGRATTIMIDQINRMRDTGPTEEEVEKAVDSFVNGQVFDYDSKSRLVSRLVTLLYEKRPIDTPERDMETYAKLTVDDVRNAAQKYLHPDKLTMLVVGNAELFDRPLSDFGTVNEIGLEKQ